MSRTRTITRKRPLRQHTSQPRTYVRALLYPAQSEAPGVLAWYRVVARYGAGFSFVFAVLVFRRCLIETSVLVGCILSILSLP